MSLTPSPTELATNSTIILGVRMRIYPCLGMTASVIINISFWYNCVCHSEIKYGDAIWIKCRHMRWIFTHDKHEYWMMVSGILLEMYCSKRRIVYGVYFLLQALNYFVFHPRLVTDNLFGYYKIYEQLRIVIIQTSILWQNINKTT